MCDPSLLMVGGLAEQLGDPLGTRKRREAQAKEEQQNKWAREDQVRSAQYAHEEKMAGLGNTNRSSLNAGSGTGTPSSTRGGGRSIPGGLSSRSQSGTANRAS